MKFKSILIALLALALSFGNAWPQASQLPSPVLCFQATAGINGMVGVLGTITGGASYTNGTYGGVPLTGGSGTNATANITVSGGIVTQVTVLNPGINYVVGDILSAAAATIGGTGSGFSVPVSSTSINSSLAGGSVGFFIPNTQTPKQTWQNSGQTVLNTNPVTLDQNGCALVYGVGTYLAVIEDSLGNVVYSQLTTATSGTNGIFWANLAGGTGNAITVTDSAFALQNGYNLQFLAAAANTGAVTIQVSGGTPIAVVKDTTTGPAPLTGGEIGPGNTPMLTYDATNVEFHLVNPSATSGSGSTSSLLAPQGYLNLVGQASGDIVQTADASGVSTVYYSPAVGNAIPIWNGSSFVQTIFSELTATLTSSGSAANAIQDACVFSNNGVPTLAIGPAWTTSTPGSGNRGSGAGSAQISKLNGLWVNAVSITGYNGLSSFTIGANRCTYVGSIWIDGTAGQVTAHRSYGYNRKFGVWNQYNRVPIVLLAGDPVNANWGYGTSQIRASNALPASYSANSCNVGSGTTCDSATVFTGNPEEQVVVSFSQGTAANSNTAAVWKIGIGLNSTTVFTGTNGVVNDLANQSGLTFQILAQATVQPFTGTNTLITLENCNSGIQTIFDGLQANMLLQAQYRG